MILDAQGGPNVSNNWCDAGILINTTAKTYQFTPLYYCMTQFSKYVHTGAVRIGASASGANSPDVMAFKNPDSSIVVIAHNGGTTNYTARVIIGSSQIEYNTTAMALDDFFWYPNGVPVVNNASKAVPSAKANLSAWRHVMGLNNSSGQQNIGLEKYSVTGKRVSESSANHVAPGVYVAKPSDNLESK